MPRRDQLKVEQEHHRKAFEVYASINGKRSYERLASELGVSVSTVKLWAKSFNWRQRLEEREAAIARQMADRVLETRAEESSQLRKLARMAILKVAKAINSGQVKIQVADLDRMIRLDAFIAESEANVFIDRELTAAEFATLIPRHWNRFSPEKQRITMKLMTGKDYVDPEDEVVENTPRQIEAVTETGGRANDETP